MAEPGPYVVRWRETNRLTHELVIMRRIGRDQVECLAPGADGTWSWLRTEPGVQLPPGEDVALEVPSEALEAIRSAAEAVLGLPPATAEANVLRLAWERERGYTAQLLDMVAEVIKRPPIIIDPGPEGGP